MNRGHIDPGAEPSGAQRNPAEPSGTQRNPAEPSGTQRNPAEPSGTQRSPTEPSGAQRSMFCWTNDVDLTGFRECSSPSFGPTSLFLSLESREIATSMGSATTCARRWYDAETCVIQRVWVSRFFMKFKIYGIPWWARDRPRNGFCYIHGVRFRSRIRWDAARRILHAFRRRELAALLIVMRRIGVRFPERDCGGILRVYLTGL